LASVIVGPLTKIGIEFAFGYKNKNYKIHFYCEWASKEEFKKKP
jgi:hypothetical protein